MTRDILDLGSWVILRMSSADTLRVTRSLRNAGLEVWTPVERRVTRMKMDRSRIAKESALLPSYAFGRVEHLAELLRIAMFPGSEHPRYSVFHYKGGVPLIADTELQALRAEEDRQEGLYQRMKRRGMKGPSLRRGTPITMPDGPFAGLSGIVEDQQGQCTLVSIDGFHKPIKVASCLLLENVAQDELPQTRAA